MKESLLGTSQPVEHSGSSKKRKLEDEEEVTAPKQQSLVKGDKKEPEEKKKEEEADPVDEVQLWKDGFRSRYYESKFGVDGDDEAFLRELVKSYCEGFSWVMKYYYQGCPSWKWFFPHHFSPFASDFRIAGDEPVKFGKQKKKNQTKQNTHLKRPLYILLQNWEHPLSPLSS